MVSNDCYWFSLKMVVEFGTKSKWLSQKGQVLLVHVATIFASLGWLGLFVVYQGKAFSVGFFNWPQTRKCFERLLNEWLCKETWGHVSTILRHYCFSTEIVGKVCFWIEKCQPYQPRQVAVKMVYRNRTYDLSFQKLNFQLNSPVEHSE